MSRSIVPPLCNFHTDAVETLNVILNEGFILPVIGELEMVTQLPTIAQRHTDRIILALPATHSDLVISSRVLSEGQLGMEMLSETKVLIQRLAYAVPLYHSLEPIPGIADPAICGASCTHRHWRPQVGYYTVGLVNSHWCAAIVHSSPPGTSAYVFAGNPSPPTCIASCTQTPCARICGSREKEQETSVATCGAGGISDGDAMSERHRRGIEMVAQEHREDAGPEETLEVSVTIAGRRDPGKDSER
ncbi:hypothetical protein H4582DRAFT_2060438 [Lactarius indigo]|nr:hypothetical protein H4582DRAFT_2060438 [Lactarius indigo]